MFGKPVCVAPTNDRCGEGPVWHEADASIYWTDINRFLIHRFDPASQTVRSWFFDEPATALSLTNPDEVLAVVLASGVICGNPQPTCGRGRFLNSTPGPEFVSTMDARIREAHFGLAPCATMYNRTDPLPKLAVKMASSTGWTPTGA
jgi:hypothetical protein